MKPVGLRPVEDGTDYITPPPLMFEPEEGFEPECLRPVLAAVEQMHNPFAHSDAYLEELIQFSYKKAH